jgi:hypothetical protein
LSHADRPVRAAVASRLLVELNQRPALHGARLEKILDVIVDNLPAEGARVLTALALQRADLASDSQLAAACLDAAFLLAPQEAIEALTQRLDRTSPGEQTGLASALLLNFQSHRADYENLHCNERLRTHDSTPGKLGFCPNWESPRFLFR